ncbi:class C sortase [Streptococcus sp. zg-86]|uniref:Class C sortase n=1 Tax=Streptococcus zhangguiae TaxID=2664091 RepID=A0A6I4RE42_9STRE|nr:MULTISPECIES: class C sortase [unclassified Streptococcus]MTB65078.1 class C sortase [Streptococcus sp. zg-86]MTB91235.1 class C sortase [Streptococcus sp. zg-36]MWV57008.1 class C sortase [Streptococcus sp. zg-70]QTH47570.1 class C sortase [Streptococcus sp. zg-86]
MVRTKKQRKWSLRRILSLFIFLVGFGVVAFPLVSQYLYYQASIVEVASFDDGVKKIDKSEIERRIHLAEAYNDSVASGNDIEIADPYSEEERKEGLKEYAKMLEVNEQIGHIRIPKIVEDLPIYAGSSEMVLQRGVGHLEGTSLPVGGNNTHAVLTAHRGLPTAKLFTNLDKLEKGDKFYIHYLGGTLAYEVDQITVIEPTDIEQLAVVQGHDYVTLLTCTPYMVNTHRLLVRGHRIDYVEAIEEKEVSSFKENEVYKVLFYVTLALFIILLILFIRMYRKHKKVKEDA